VLAPLGVDDVETAIGDVTDAAAVVRADGEHVRGDPGERADLAEPAGHAEQPRKAEHSARDEDHVLAADRERMDKA
jgi:hypothetical protein